MAEAGEWQWRTQRHRACAIAPARRLAPPLSLAVLRLQVSARLCEAVSSGEYNFVCVNFANPDMVGHTGSLPAAIAACEAVDRCVGDLVKAVDTQSGTILITARGGGRRWCW